MAGVELSTQIIQKKALDIINNGAERIRPAGCCVERERDLGRVAPLDGMNIPVLIPPTGGMFEYVSGANFLGEITEWVGFALAGHSAHSAAFAVFTAVVLASRAVAHHK